MLIMPFFFFPAEMILFWSLKIIITFDIKPIVVLLSSGENQLRSGYVESRCLGRDTSPLFHNAYYYIIISWAPGLGEKCTYFVYLSWSNHNFLWFGYVVLFGFPFPFFHLHNLAFVLVEFYDNITAFVDHFLVTI